MWFVSKNDISNSWQSAVKAQEYSGGQCVRVFDVDVQADR